MPDFGTSNRVALRRVAETVWGETPSTPQLDALRFTSEGLNYNADFVKSEEIRFDRMTPDTVQTASSGSGEISGEWSYGSYDDLIEAALFGTWATTGSTIAADSEIGIVKTPGTPNIWALTSVTTDLSAQGWTIGQFLRVEGFTVAGTFWVEVAAAPTAGSVVVKPITDVETESAGDAITITPTEFLRNGTTKRSFTMQKEFADLTTPEFLNLSGSRISTWGLELGVGSILTTNFGVMARDAVMTETQFAGATFGAATTTDVLNAVNNIAAIVFDGDPGADQFYFNSLSINLDNALRGQDAVGTLGYIGVEAGRLTTSGSIELYFENSRLYDRFRNATAFSLTFLAQDGAGNSYLVTLPRAKYTSMEIVAGGLDQDIVVSAEFEGLVNTAGTYQYQISRLAA